ncbi:hypothetical protein HNQ59_001797 [Chitinivorax tropicus]|uniref:Uncharacterized protein n=1 Tax=Chitinivorax tropicus TaxID=714531 RepID=A0A840MIN2_9PROT|nr:hypothetical protein [Chitinivorax tropicus]MBB5018508.1 hypothetical protein [Chitinivorax tropicus]
MLPPVSAIVGIEMIRDGGSLRAEFIGVNGSNYCLHFELISEESSTGELVRLGYERPVVFERLRLREENRIVWEAINQVEVSWVHATVLLQQLRAHPQSEHDFKWLATMEEVAKSEGAIPDDILRALGPVRALRPDA